MKTVRFLLLILSFIGILAPHTIFASTNFTYTENKSHNIIYKEDSEGNQYLFFKDKEIIRDQIRSCDILYTQAEEKSEILRGRKCINTHLNVENIGHNWIRLRYLSGNFFQTIFYHTPTGSIHIGSGRQVLVGKNGIYILSSENLGNTSHTKVTMLLSTGTKTEVFQTTNYYEHISMSLLKNKRILITYTDNNNKKQSQIVSIRK